MYKPEIHLTCYWLNFNMALCPLVLKPVFIPELLYILFLKFLYPPKNFQHPSILMLNKPPDFSSLNMYTESDKYNPFQF